MSTVGGYKARSNAETQCYQWIKECCNSSVEKKPVQRTLDSFFGNKWVLVLVFVTSLFKKLQNEIVFLHVYNCSTM